MVMNGRNLAMVPMGPSGPTVVYSRHPMLPELNRIVRAVPFWPGESLLKYLSRLGLYFGAQPVVLFINGERCPREDWAFVYMDPGDLITIRAQMHRGGDSDPLRTILTIAVLAAAGPLGGSVNSFFGLAAESAFGSALITIGGMLLVDALLPPPDPASQDNDASPTFSLSGAQNRARLYQPMPVVIGAHRIFPDSGAKPYTEFQGNDQYLYQVFNFGLSDITLTDIKIGDTPIASYSDVTTEISGADGALSLFPANVDSVAGLALTVGAGFTLRTGSINSDALMVDFSGLIFYMGARGLEQLRITIGIQYRAVGSGTWLNFVTGGTVALDHGSRKPMRRSYRLDVAKGQYEVQVEYVSVTRRSLRRVADNPQADPRDRTYSTVETFIAVDINDVKVSAKLTWDQLKSYQADTADYTGQKRLAIMIKASGQLNGALDRLNAVATQDVPVWTGAAWVIQASSNPAWLYLWWARGKANPAGQRMFGALLPDARIDIEALKLWGAWCDLKSLSFNFVLDTKQNVFQALKLIARAGRAAPTWSAGILGAIFDQDSKPVTNLYGMSNIRRGSFRVNYLTGRLADEVVVEWINPALGYAPDTVRQVVPGVTTPVNPVHIKLQGVTNESQAGREANLIAAEQLYRRRSVSWETDIEGLTDQRGDVVALSHDLTQWGYSGRLVSGTTTVLQLGRAVPFTPAMTHFISVRFPDGTIEIVDVVIQVGEADTITLITALSSSPDADPDNPPQDYVWQFEPKATPGKQVKITDIRPIEEHRVRITATDEDDAYYLAENDTYVYVAPATFGADVPTLSNLVIKTTLILSGSGYATRVTVAWDVSGEYGSALVRAGFDGEDLADIGKTFDQFIEFEGPEDADVTVEVTGFNQIGEYGATSRLTASLTYVGKADLPEDVTGFSALQNGTNVVFKWSPVADADLSGYEIRYGPRGNTSWADATPLTEVTKGTNITSADVAPGDWTFYIKAEDTSLNQSPTETSVDVLVSTGADVIVSQINAPGWPGIITNFVIHHTGVLVPLSQNLASADLWETFDQFVVNPVAVATYEATEIDIAFDDQSRVWGEISSALGPGEIGIANPLFELDYRLAAGSYDGFEPWSVGEVTLRYAKGKLTVDTSNGVPYVQQLQVVVDQLEHTKKAAGVTIAAGGTVIAFPTPFHTPPFVRAFAEGNAALLPTFELVSANDFKFHLWDTGGVDVGGSGAWDATGV